MLSFLEILSKSLCHIGVAHKLIGATTDFEIGSYPLQGLKPSNRNIKQKTLPGWERSTMT